MSLALVIITAVIDIFIVMPLIFIAVAFAGSATGGPVGEKITPLQWHILDACIFLVPGLCLVSAAIVIYGYVSGWNALTYCWYVLPFAGFISFAVYIFGFLTR